MAVREESVRISLVDDFSTGAAKIAAATALMHRNLEDLDGSSTSASKSTDSLSAATKAATPAMTRMSSEVDKLGKKLNAEKTSLASAEAALAHMRAELEGASGDTSELEAAIAKQAKTVERYKSSVTQTEATLRAYSATQRELGVAAETAAQDTDKLAASTDKAGRSMANGRKEIDSYAGRLGILGDALAISSPALVAFGAVGATATAGLSAGLALVIGTAGTAIVAFQGVGDAVKALTKYNAAPTTANLQAAQEAMAQLGPDAAQFVLEFQKITPVLREVRDAAAAGWFPGLTKALDDLTTQAPRVEALFKAVGTAAGNSTADFASQVKNGAYNDFLTFLQSEAPQAITSLGSTLGSLTHGLATLLAQTGSVDNGFLAWINDAAKGFDRWTQSAKGRQDIQSFLDYVREQGPNVAELLGNVTKAVAEIAKAAAPLSGVTLKAFNDLAEVIAKIAGSDLGTPIVAGVIALSALNRALAVTNSLSGSAFGQSALGKNASNALGSRLGSAFNLSSFTDARSQYAVLAAEETRALTGQTKLGAGASALRANFTGMAAGAAKAGLAVGALALITSDAGKKFEGTNTASLALAGSFLGPWGAAIGAAIGGIRDVRSYDASWAQSIDAVSQSIGNQIGLLNTRQATINALNSKSSASIGSQRGTIDTSSASGLLDALGTATKATLTHPVDAAETAFATLTGQQTKAEQAATAAAAAQLRYNDTLVGLGKLQERLGGPDVLPTSPILKWSASLGQVAPKLGDVQTVAARVQPALAALGLSFDDLNKVSARNQVAAYFREADSQSGRIDAVKQAVASLGTNMQNAATGAQALDTALTGLFSPGENLSAATDTWNASLRNLGSTLDKSSKSLTAQTNAGDQNRASIRQQVDNLHALLVAQAGAGDSAAKVTRTFRDQRQALIQAGVAAGLSKGQLQTYLRTLGLTPKAVQTLIKNNAPQAGGMASAYKAVLDSIPRNITTQIKIATQRVNSVINEVESIAHRGGAHADGGYITGPGGPRDDRIPAWLSNGEFVVNAAATRANLDLLHAINAQRYADGGHVGHHGGKDKPLFTGEGPAWYKRAYKHGRPFAIDGPDKWDYPYQSGTGSQKNERAFENWVNKNKVPFDAGARLVDYDMRGYWNKTHGKGWHQGSHFPDTWKTPYDTTFSSESMYATKDNPFNWHGDSLYDDRNGQLIFAAMGGLISGPGGPTDDRIPARLSNGEFVVNAASTKAHFELLRDINNSPSRPTATANIAPWDKPAWWTGLVGLNVQGHVTEGLLKKLNHAVDDSTKAMDKQKSALDAVRQNEQQLASTVRSSLMSDLFAAPSSSSVWAAGSTLADPNAILRTDITHARQYNSLLSGLRRRGLSGGALQAAEEAGLPGLQVVSQYGRSGLRQYEALFAERARLVRVASVTSGASIYGAAVRENTRKLDQIRDEVRTLRHEQTTLQRRLSAEKKAAAAKKKREDDARSKQNSADTSKGVNSAATSGHKRRVHG